MFSISLRYRGIPMILSILSLVLLLSSWSYSDAKACGGLGYHQHYPSILQVNAPESGDTININPGGSHVQVAFNANIIPCGHDWDFGIRIYLDNLTNGDEIQLFNGDLLDENGSFISSFSNVYRVRGVNTHHSYRIRVETNAPAQTYSGTFKFIELYAPDPIPLDPPVKGPSLQPNLPLLPNLPQVERIETNDIVSISIVDEDQDKSDTIDINATDEQATNDTVDIGTIGAEQDTATVAIKVYLPLINR